MVNFWAVRAVGFFTWNSQSFLERWARRAAVALLALIRPFFYAANRVFATRVLHTLLRGVSQDRLDLLGEEYFEYRLKPRLNQRSVEELKKRMAQGESVVLVSQALEHLMKPLARYLGVERLIANRLEFRDGLATGRLLSPVIRPRGAYAFFVPLKTDGSIPFDRLAEDLDMSAAHAELRAATIPAQREIAVSRRPTVVLDSKQRVDRLSVREALAGKHVLLIGTTGFIGKVWLAKILSDLPEAGRIYLLIRRQRSTSAVRRFEKIVEESPVFETFHEQHGEDLARFLSERVEVVEGDVCKPGLGIEPEVRERLMRDLDLIVNSSGLTDFNPDLRQALATNVDATMQLLDFVRQCDHAALLHLSTCYVAGARDGRVIEEVRINYIPNPVRDFDAEHEYQSLWALVRETEAKSESAEMTDEIRRQVLKAASGKKLSAETVEAQIRKNRARRVREELVEVGMRRAKELGWPNTYTFTKSLAESLIVKHGSDLPIAVVRPSIVETSTHEPFQGWNEGVNTSAPLSYLLGTYFRQLPSNERKCLDLIPVDLVCRGMTLIAAALVQRCHANLYQLATSADNPCNMRRSIELTSLGHRKFYRAQESLEPRWRAHFDSIAVSKTRYKALSAPGQKAVVRTIQKISAPIPMARQPLVRRERGLDRVEKLIELYEPFILHNEIVFEAINIGMLSAVLPSEEVAAFGYDALSIDWWDYWINIHIPALRRWSYPLIEGRPIETRPPRVFHLIGTPGAETAISESALASRQ